jgi:hypothetical protein
MANVYEWLEDIHPHPYAPTSPALEPMDVDHFAGIPTDEITSLNIDGEGNMHFDFPHTLS